MTTLIDAAINDKDLLLDAEATVSLFRDRAVRASTRKAINDAIIAMAAARRLLVAEIRQAEDAADEAAMALLAQAPAKKASTLPGCECPQCLKPHDFVGGFGSTECDVCGKGLRHRAHLGAVHTVGGIVIGTHGTKYADGIPYGTTHDMDCPGCQNTPFTASPRSETYWAS